MKKRIFDACGGREGMFFGDEKEVKLLYFQ